jgi:6,7-dimethyl-8-ribityllumazine synthase
MLYEGDFATPPVALGRVAIIAARFNAFIVDPLLSGARDALQRHGIPDERIDTIRVPGSYEIPLVAQRLGQSGQYAAIICLGCVIRGETGHYDHVAGAAANGIARASLDTGVPVIFGVLTTDTLDQAINRAGAKAGNKGFEAAVVAIEMMNLLAKLPSHQPTHQPTKQPGA